MVAIQAIQARVVFFSRDLCSIHCGVSIRFQCKWSVNTHILIDVAAPAVTAILAKFLTYINDTYWLYTMKKNTLEIYGFEFVPKTLMISGFLQIYEDFW